MSAGIKSWSGSGRGAVALLGLLVGIGGAQAGAAAYTSGVAEPWVHGWNFAGAGDVKAVVRDGRISATEANVAERALSTNRGTLDRIVLLSRSPSLLRMKGVPHYKTIAAAGTALQARARLKAHAGDTDGAVRDWLAAMRLGQSMMHGSKGGPYLMEVVVGTKMELWAARDLISHVRSLRVNGQQLAWIRQALDDRARHGVPTLTEAIRSEYDLALSEVRRYPDTTRVTDLWASMGMDDDVSRNDRRETMTHVANRFAGDWDAYHRSAIDGYKITEPRPRDNDDEELKPYAYQAFFKRAVPYASRAAELVQDRGAALRRLRLLTDRRDHIKGVARN